MPFFGLSGAGVQPAENRLIEFGVPDHAFRVYERVMRLCVGPGHIKFGVNDLGGFALGSREALQLEIPRLDAHINRGQILLEFLISRSWPRAERSHGGMAKRSAPLIIPHSNERGHPSINVVGALEHMVQIMATSTI